MRYLYILIILLFSCKADKKQGNEQKYTHKDDIEHKIHRDGTREKETYVNFQRLNRESFVGKEYQYLDEFEDFKNCRYGGFDVLIECGEKKIDIIKVYFEENESPHLLILVEKNDDKFERQFKITDVLNLSQERLLQQPENFVLISDKYTKYGKVINLPIAAIIKEQYEEEFFMNMYKAWKVDCETGRFVEILIEGIKVENEEYYGI